MVELVSESFELMILKASLSAGLFYCRFPQIVQGISYNRRLECMAIIELAARLEPLPR